MADRELTFQINADAKAELEAHLRIAPVTVTVHSVFDTRQLLSGGVKGGRNVHGDHTPGHIRLYLGATFLSGSRLTLVNQEVVKTLLHEYRHEYQLRHWDAKRLREDKRLPYNLQECEADAEEWAQRNVLKWLKLGRVRAKSRSVFAAQNRRLAKAGLR